MGVISFPLEYALWATNAIDLTEFVPKLFREHFDNIGQMQTGLARGKGSWTVQSIRTMHLGVIKDLNDKRIKDFGIEVRPRVNAENFCILSSGSVYYVPQVDQTAFYVKVLRDSYDPVAGLIKSNSEIPEIRDQPLLTDWVNDAFSYTDTSGKTSSIELRGAIALDDVTINRWLRQRLDKYSEEGLENLGSMGHAICTQFNLYDQTPMPSQFYMYKNYKSMLNWLRHSDVGEMPYAQAVDIAYSATESAEDLTETSRKVLREFVRLSSLVADNLMAGRNAYISRARDLFFFYVWGKYVNKRETFSDAAEVNRLANAPVEVKNTFEIPNSPGFEKVLPHQAEAISQFDSPNPPMYVSLEVSAGGGKTTMIFANMMMLKAKGKIKVAMVVCPGNLVKEWTSEVNRMCRGQVNVIPITTNIVKKMRDHMGYDKAGFLAYLKAAPVNTIFVVSLNFLRGTTDHFTGERFNSEMQYGEHKIKFYPNVQLLRQLNPDYIAIDESHKVKNRNSDLSKAFSGLSPVAKYRLIASGTMTPNDPTDIVAQSAILNPAILGNISSFTKNFGIERNGKFAELAPGAGRVLSDIRKPYMSRIYKTRPDWSFLLPNINTEIVPCAMTENQTRYYNFMMSEAMKALRDDPEIQKIRENADDKQLARLEKLLDTKLNIVETFVNAPDENTVFMNKKDYNLKEEDKVSCKVRKIDEILNEHFNVLKDENKVIIFGINKVVSRHIFRHTRFRNVAIHYAVKDSLSGVSGGDALLKFRNDPKIKILIADATSMREGLNLQTASRVIYVQTEWSPGAQEQAISRAMRPDVPNKYKRENIYIQKLAAVGTYEVAKVAKLINKEVVNKDLASVDDPEWHKYVKNTPIPNLEPIRMNLKLIEEIKDFTHPDVIQSRKCYESIIVWEQNEFTRSRNKLVMDTARRLSISPAEVNLRRDALLPVDGASRLPASKSIFVPIENGAVPVDNRRLNLIPIAVLKKDDDDAGNTNEEDDDSDAENDDNADLEDNTTYSEGDTVQTEYGFGKIVRIMDKQVRVSIPGFNNGDPITINKQVVFMPSKPSPDDTNLSQTEWQANYDKLHKDIKKAGDKGVLFTNGYTNPVLPATAPAAPVKPVKEADHPAAIVKPIKPIKPAPVDDDEDETPVVAPKDKLPPSSKAKLDVVPIVANGMPTLLAYTDEKGFDKLQQDHGNWYKVAPFYAAHVQTLNGAKRLAKAIQDAGFTIVEPPAGANGRRPPNQLARMLGLAKKLTGGATDNKLLVRSSASSVAAGMTNFYAINHTKTRDPNSIRVYPLIYNDELFLCVPIGNQPAQANKMRALPKIVGVGKFDKYSKMAVQTFATPKKAAQALTNIAKKEKLGNLNEAQEYLTHPSFNKLCGY
jgi:hypothetical protein